MQLQQSLADKGFTVSSEDKIICRMRLGNLKVDVMPDDPAILGFSNRWYKEGIHTSIRYTLPSGREIRHLTPPLFLATKFEAYGDRGNNDLLGSHDLEDVLNVVDGRATLLDEVRAASSEVRCFLADQFGALLAHPDLDTFLHGNVRGPEGRVDMVHASLKALANSG